MLSDIVRDEAKADVFLLPADAWPTKSRCGHKTEERIVQNAVNETGFGKFNIKIMAVSSFINANVALSITSIGLVLPSAACDFKMSTIDKGRLSTIMMFGMLCGSYMWGCMADMKGRRVSLLIALFVHGSSEFLASLVSSYWGFVVLKFVSGIAMNGQVTLVFVYLGEFQPTKYRDRFLSWLDLPWVIGTIIAPVIGSLVIPLSVEVTIGTFFFHSWNFFVLMCALPALLTGAWLMYLPETPKFLAESGQDAKLLDTLEMMYVQNTGNPATEYRVKLQNTGDRSLFDLTSRALEQKVRNGGLIKNESLKSMMRAIVRQTAAVLRKPYLTRTVLMCIITFSLMSSYYAFVLWLPEVFRRFADFEEVHRNQSATVCSITSTAQNMTSTGLDPFGCSTSVPISVYVHTIILGVSCIPTALALPLFIDYLGYKYFLIFTTIVAGAVTTGLYVVQTSLQNLIFSCLYEAFTSVSNSVVFCMLIELYPTDLRATAAGLSAFFSRFGAMIGNVMVAYMIDSYCVSLVGIITMQLFLSGAVAFFIPGRNQLEAENASPTENESI